MRAEWKEREKRWRREHEVAERHRLLPKLLRKRAESVEEAVERWVKARGIRSFLKALDQSVDTPSRSRRLARWAVLYADHVDPLIDYRIEGLEREYWS